MVFKIRNIKDELNIQTELMIIMSFWIVFSIGYFTTLFLSISRGVLCDKEMDESSEWIIFAFIQSRNFFTLLVSTLYCLRMAFKPHLAYNKDVVSLTTLYDFNTVMVSVLPYTYFKKFIYTEQ